MAGKPDPKQPRRIVDREAGKEMILAARNCFGCNKTVTELRTSGLVLTRFHLVGKDLGGDDVEDNIVPVCGSGTTGCHGVWENREKGWETVAANVRANMSPRNLAYILRKKNARFLDRYFSDGRIGR